MKERIIKKPFTRFILRVNKDLFSISVITYLVFYIMEFIKKGFISNYINLNIILYIAIITGVIFIIFNKLEYIKDKIAKKDYLWIVGISLAGAIIIFLKTRVMFEWLSIVIGILIFIFLLSVLLMNSKGGEDKEEKREEKFNNKKRTEEEKIVRKEKVRKLIS